jgi:drug/metabolite transporter (DMT)-like permease
MDNPGQARSNVLRGIVLMCAAVLCFTVMDALIKHLAGRYPTLQLVFARNLFALIPVLIPLIQGGGLKLLRTRRPVGHALRAVFGLISMCCFFYAYGQLELATVIAIGFSGPLFMTALSVPMLGEAVGWRRWTAVLVGFVGVLIMTRPGVGMLEVAALVAVFGAFLYALVVVVIRKLGATEHPATIVLYFTFSSAVVSGAAMPFLWVTPTLADWPVLVGIGLIGGIAQLTMTRAFMQAPVAVIAPFEYSSMIWAVTIGYFFWGEVPDVWVWVGTVIVVASGLFILYRETRRRRM